MSFFILIVLIFTTNVGLVLADTKEQLENPAILKPLEDHPDY